MTCDEFRERLHLLLDERRAELTDEAMVAHLGGCESCDEFRRELMALDSALRQIPVPPIPDSLFNSLRDIGVPREIPAPAWKPDVGRAARYLIPGLFLWGAQWAAPESARPWFLAAITFLGVFTFVTSVLRPRILGSAGQ
jgi:hypothetical protein